MPASPLALFSVAPAAGTAPGAAAGQAVGQGAAAGFEALLASLFGAVSQGPATGATPVAPAIGGDEEEDQKVPEADTAGDTTVSADALALAAMLIASQQQPQPVIQAPPPAVAEGGGAPAAAKLAQAIPTAGLAPDQLLADAIPENATPAPAADVDAPADAPKVETDPLALLALADDPRRAAAPAQGGAQAPKTPPVAVPQVQAPQAAVAPAPTTPVEVPATELPAEALAAVDAEAEAPATEPGRPRTSPRESHAKAASAESAAAPQTEAAITPASAPSSGQPKADKDGGEKPQFDVPVVAADSADLQVDQPDGVAQSVATADIAGAERPHHNAAAIIRGAPETVASLAAEIVKKLEGRTTRFDVELDPAGLGRVDVRVEIGAHGRLTAAMAFDNPQAAAELRSRAGELQKALEQAGFDISGGLSFDFTGDRGQSGQGQGLANQQQDNSGNASRGRAFQAALDVAGEASDTAMSGLLHLQRRTDSGLDIRI